MCLVLTDNANKHHTYDIPECVYDLESSINIIGVPYLGKHFGDQATGLYEDDGTTVKSGSTKSNFFWDHGKHGFHFMHGSRKLPELYLYFGQGYFKAFSSRIQKYSGNKVHYAFSSDFSLEPNV